MNYVPINSVLYQLSLDIDPSEWNENSVLEWALSSARQIGGLSLFTTVTEYYQIVDHTLKKPTGLKTLNQIEVYSPSLSYTSYTNAEILDRISRRTDAPAPELYLRDTTGMWLNDKTNRPWRAVYKSNGHFINACNTSNIRNCVPEYIEEMNSYKFSFKDGVIGINYLAYAKEGGEYMIPDIESYKLAIQTYVAYKLYVIKARSEQTQFNVSERNRLAKDYTSLSLKAIGAVNQASIDVGTMESVKNIRNRFVSGNQFESGFQGLGKPTKNTLF